MPASRAPSQDPARGSLRLPSSRARLQFWPSRTLARGWLRSGSGVAPEWLFVAPSGSHWNARQRASGAGGNHAWRGSSAGPVAFVEVRPCLVDRGPSTESHQRVELAVGGAHRRARRRGLRGLRGLHGLHALCV